MFKRIENKTPTTITFVIVCIIALILNNLTNGYTNLKFFSTYHSSLTDIFTYLRFFTHVFGHVSYEHFTSNILLILVLGPALELRYGSKKLMSYILITAGITGVLNYIFFPKVVLLGASGIVFMMIVLNAYIKTSSGSIALSFIIVIVIYLGKEIYGALILKDYISQFAHIIGGVCGWVLGKIHYHK